MKDRSSLIQRLGRGLLWNYLGRLTEFGLRFVLFTNLARGLGDEGYGQYSFVMSIFGIASLLASLGLEQAVNTFTAQWRARPAQLRYLLNVMLGTRAAAVAVLAGIIWVAAGLLARRVGAAPAAIQAMLLYLVSYNIYNLLLYYLIGRLDVGFAALIRVAVTAANVVLVWAVLDEGGIVAALLVQGGTALLALLATLVWLRQDLLGPRERVSVRRPMGFAMTLGLTTGLNFVLGQQSDVFLLGLLLRDPAQIGDYNLAANLNFMLSTALLIGFEGVTQSALSEVAARDLGRLAAAWSTLLKLSMACSLPPLLFGAVHSTKLVALYGADYSDSALLLQAYLLFSFAGRLLGGGLNTALLYTLGREKIPLAIRAASGIGNVALAVLLIRALGPLGAVLATGAAVFSTGLVETAFTLRLTGAVYPWRFATKVVVASLAAVTASYPLMAAGWIGLVAGALITALIFLATLTLLRPLAPEERALASRLVPQIAPVLRYLA